MRVRVSVQDDTGDAQYHAETGPLGMSKTCQPNRGARFGLRLPIRRDEHTQVYIHATLASSGIIREIKICLRLRVSPSGGCSAGILTCFHPFKTVTNSHVSTVYFLFERSCVSVCVCVFVCCRAALHVYV